jgi:hypothetical protein
LDDSSILIGETSEITNKLLPVASGEESFLGLSRRFTSSFALIGVSDA